MKNIVLLISVLGILSACNEKHHKMSPEEISARVDSLKTDLLKTDLAFSQLSQQKGRNAAFLEYADSGATMLSPFRMPITGHEGIMKLMAEHPDTSYTLTWMPIKADIARSGDLGYTYGTYSLVLKGRGNEAGTYCTIWKRDKTHNWKFILDTGNEGLKPEDKE
jgi:hypothetical protein